MDAYTGALDRIRQRYLGSGGTDSNDTSETQTPTDPYAGVRGRLGITLPATPPLGQGSPGAMPTDPGAGPAMPGAGGGMADPEAATARMLKRAMLQDQRTPGEAKFSSLWQTDPGQTNVSPERRAALEGTAVGAAQGRGQVMKAADHDPFAYDILHGNVTANEVAEMNPAAINWDYIGKQGGSLSVIDKLKGWTPRWQQIASLGQKDPEAGKTALVNLMREREGSGIWEFANRLDAVPAMTGQYKPPAQTVGGTIGGVGGFLGAIAHPGGGEGGQFANAAGEAAGALPGVAKAAPWLQKSIHGAVHAAGTGLDIHARQEAVRSLQEGANYDNLAGLGRVAKGTLEFAGFGGIGGAVGAGLEGAGRLPALARFAAKYPGFAGVAGPAARASISGLASGIGVGGVRSGIEELQQPDPSIAHWVHNTLMEGGQNASQELVQALAYSLSGILSGRPLPPPEGVRRAMESEAQAQSAHRARPRPLEAPFAPGTPWDQAAFQAKTGLEGQDLIRVVDQHLAAGHLVQGLDGKYVWQAPQGQAPAPQPGPTWEQSLAGKPVTPEDFFRVTGQRLSPLRPGPDGRLQGDPGTTVAIANLRQQGRIVLDPETLQWHWAEPAPGGQGKPVPPAVFGEQPQAPGAAGPSQSEYPDYDAAVQELAAKWEQEHGGQMVRDQLAAKLRADQQANNTPAPEAPPAPARTEPAAPNLLQDPRFQKLLAEYQARNPDIPLGVAQELVRSMMGGEQRAPQPQQPQAMVTQPQATAPVAPTQPHLAPAAVRPASEVPGTQPGEAPRVPLVRQNSRVQVAGRDGVFVVVENGKRWVKVKQEGVKGAKPFKVERDALRPVTPTPTPPNKGARAGRQTGDALNVAQAPPPGSGQGGPQASAAGSPEVTALEKAARAEVEQVSDYYANGARDPEERAQARIAAVGYLEGQPNSAYAQWQAALKGNESRLPETNQEATTKPADSATRTPSLLNGTKLNGYWNQMADRKYTVQIGPHPEGGSWITSGELVERTPEDVQKAAGERATVRENLHDVIQKAATRDAQGNHYLLNDSQGETQGSGSDQTRTFTLPNGEQIVVKERLWEYAKAQGYQIYASTAKNPLELRYNGQVNGYLFPVSTTKAATGEAFKPTSVSDFGKMDNATLLKELESLRGFVGDIDEPWAAFKEARSRGLVKTNVADLDEHMRTLYKNKLTDVKRTSSGGDEAAAFDAKQTLLRLEFALWRGDTWTTTSTGQQEPPPVAQEKPAPQRGAVEMVAPPAAPGKLGPGAPVTYKLSDGTVREGTVTRMGDPNVKGEKGEVFVKVNGKEYMVPVSMLKVLPPDQAGGAEGQGAKLEPKPAGPETGASAKPPSSPQPVQGDLKPQVDAVRRQLDQADKSNEMVPLMRNLLDTMDRAIAGGTANPEEIAANLRQIQNDLTDMEATGTSGAESTGPVASPRSETGLPHGVSMETYVQTRPRLEQTIGGWFVSGGRDASNKSFKPKEYKKAEAYFQELATRHEAAVPAELRDEYRRSVQAEPLSEQNVKPVDAMTPAELKAEADKGHQNRTPDHPGYWRHSEVSKERNRLSGVESDRQKVAEGAWIPSEPHVGAFAIITHDGKEYAGQIDGEKDGKWLFRESSALLHHHPVEKDDPTLEAMVPAPRQGASEAKPAGGLPPIGDNYLKPLREYAPTMYRETSIADALGFIAQTGATDPTLDGELYFANTPNLALGQGANKGVLLELDSSELKGQVNRSKPAWQAAWDAGEAEFVARHNKQRDYQNALRAVTVKPDAETSAGYRTRLKRTLAQLEQEGWTKTTNADGSLTYRRPGAESKSAAPVTEGGPSQPEQPKSSGVTMQLNAEKEGVELTFANKPSNEVRVRMKTAGFQPKKRADDTWYWYAKQNDNTMGLAHELTNGTGEAPTEALRTTRSNQGAAPAEGAAQPDRGSVVARKLRGAADTLKRKVDEIRGKDRKTHTARMAGQAENAVKEADQLEVLQKQLEAVANATENGELPQSLRTLRTKADVEWLAQQAKQAVYTYNRVKNVSYRGDEMPTPTVEHIAEATYPRAEAEVSNLQKILDATKNIRGVMGQQVQAVKKALARSTGSADRWVDVRQIAEYVDGLAKEVLDKDPKAYWAEATRRHVANVLRARMLGFSDLDKYQAALRDFVEVTGGKTEKSAEQKQKDKLAAMERDLVGTNIAGYFPTPKPLVDAMLAKADIQPGQKVLEPSAGKGNIADAIREAAPDAELHTVEVVPRLRTLLEAKGHKLAGTDFMEHTGEYDRIVMNPPFENGQDIEHVQRAYDMLKPGGRVVAIMSEGPFFRGDKKAQGFRDWLDQVGGTSEKNAEGAFKSSDRPTGVATRTVVIEKPAAGSAKPEPGPVQTESTGTAFKPGDGVTWPGKGGKPETGRVVGPDAKQAGYWIVKRPEPKVEASVRADLLQPVKATEPGPAEQTKQPWQMNWTEYYDSRRGEYQEGEDHDAFRKKLESDWEKVQYGKYGSFANLRSEALRNGYKGASDDHDTNRIAMRTFLDRLENPRKRAEIDADLEKTNAAVAKLEDLIAKQRTPQGAKADADTMTAMKSTLQGFQNLVSMLQTELSKQPGEVEPWKMTRQAYIDHRLATSQEYQNAVKNTSDNAGIVREQVEKSARQKHEAAVMMAALNKQTVPPEVLADYKNHPDYAVLANAGTKGTKPTGSAEAPNGPAKTVNIRQIKPGMWQAEVNGNTQNAEAARKPHTLLAKHADADQVLWNGKPLNSQQIIKKLESERLPDVPGNLSHNLDWQAAIDKVKAKASGAATRPTEGALPATAGTPATPEPGKKEPWQMPLEEYLASRYVQTTGRPGERESERDARERAYQAVVKEHGKAVDQAMRDGKNVPEENLPNYAMPFGRFAQHEYGGTDPKVLDEVWKDYQKVVRDASDAGDPVPHNVLAVVAAGKRPGAAEPETFADKAVAAGVPQFKTERAAYEALQRYRNLLEKPDGTPDARNQWQFLADKLEPLVKGYVPPQKQLFGDATIPEKPLGDVRSDDESRYFGTEVSVLGETGQPDIWKGTVTRVLNGGELLEVDAHFTAEHTRDGRPTNIRVEGQRIKVDKLVDAEANKPKPVVEPEKPSVPEPPVDTTGGKDPRQLAYEEEAVAKLRETKGFTATGPQYQQVREAEVRATAAREWQAANATGKAQAPTPAPTVSVTESRDSNSLQLTARISPELMAEWRKVAGPAGNIEDHFGGLREQDGSTTVKGLRADLTTGETSAKQRNYNSIASRIDEAVNNRGSRDQKAEREAVGRKIKHAVMDAIFPGETAMKWTDAEGKPARITVRKVEWRDVPYDMGKAAENDGFDRKKPVYMARIDRLGADPTFPWADHGLLGRTDAEAVLEVVRGHKGLLDRSDAKAVSPLGQKALDRVKAEAEMADQVAKRTKAEQAAKEKDTAEAAAATAARKQALVEEVYQAHKGEKMTLTLHMEKGGQRMPDQEVAAFEVAPGWAVHKKFDSKNQWIPTHIGTGVGAGAFDSRAEATAVAVRLSHAVPDLAGATERAALDSRITTLRNALKAHTEGEPFGRFGGGTEAEPAKAPWQMTPTEFQAAEAAKLAWKYSIKPEEVSKKYPKAYHDNLWWEDVMQAARDGKRIPNKVLDALVKMKGEDAFTVGVLRANSANERLYSGYQVPSAKVQAKEAAKADAEAKKQTTHGSLTPEWKRFASRNEKELLAADATDGGVWVTDRLIVERMDQRPTMPEGYTLRDMPKAERLLQTYQGEGQLPMDSLPSITVPIDGRPTKVWQMPDGTALGLQEKLVQYAAEKGWTLRAKPGQNAFGMYDGDRFMGVIMGIRPDSADLRAAAQQIGKPGNEAVAQMPPDQGDLQAAAKAAFRAVKGQGSSAMAKQAPVPDDAATQEMRNASKWDTDKVPLKERLANAPATVKNWLDRYWDEFHDEYGSVTRAAEDLLKQGRAEGLKLPEKVKDLPARANPVLMVENMAKTVPGHTEHMANELEKALKPIGHRQEEYFLYADAKRAVTMRHVDANGRPIKPKFPFTMEAAKALVARIESDPEASLFVKTLEAEQKVIWDGLRAEMLDSGLTDQAGMDQLKKIDPYYVPFFRDPEALKARQAERSKRTDSLPDTGGTGRSLDNLSNPVKRMKGDAELPLMDPRQRRIRMIARTLGLAERNRVFDSFYSLHEMADPHNRLMEDTPKPMEHMGVGFKEAAKKLADFSGVRVSDLLGQLEDMGADPNNLQDPNGVLDFFRPTYPGENDTRTRFFRNGKEKWVDWNNEDVLKAISSMDKVTTNLVANFIQKGVKLYKTGATSSVGFGIANIARDAVEGLWLSEHQVYPLHAMFKAIQTAAEDQPFVKRALQEGLKHGGWGTPKEMSLRLADALKPKTGADYLNPYQSAKLLWKFYNGTFREGTEFMTRLGETKLEYNSQLRQKGYDLKELAQKIKDGTATEKEIADEEDAFLKGLNIGNKITLNFTRKGRTAKQIGKYVPFFEIPFEVGTRAVEAAKSHPGMFLTKTILGALAFGLASSLIGHDNKLKQEASDQEKDSYFLIPSPSGNALFRVPKPQGPMGLLTNTVERAMRAWADDDPNAWNKFWPDATQALFPRASSPGIDFLVALSSGYDLQQGQPIVNSTLAKLPKDMQYTADTPGSVKAISKVLPGTLGSPMVTQYAIDKLFPGYSAGVFALEKSLLNEGPPSRKPAGWLVGEDNSLVGRFISRPGEGKQGRSVGLFYDQLDQATQTYEKIRAQIMQATGQDVTMNALTPAQARAKAQAMAALSPDERAAFDSYSGLRKASDQLSTVRKRLNAVKSDQKMADDKQRQEIERLNRYLTEMAAKAIKPNKGKRPGA